MLLAKFIHINMDKIKRPKLYTLPDALQVVQPCRRYDLPGVVCLASGTACAAACGVQTVRVRWGLGSPPAGYMGRAGGWVVDTSRRKNSKKAFSSPTHPLFSAKNTPPHIVNLKNSAQKQKDPYKGSVFCAILALQALKGRNLQ
jgi:hypothetical protein